MSSDRVKPENYNNIFDDDEMLDAPQADASGEISESIIAGKTFVKVFHKRETSFADSDFNVLLELTGVGNPKNNSGLDIVAVLDVSGSMGPKYNKAKEDRMPKLKIAMQFVIKKLRPIDRLSVVTFTETADKVYGFRNMTEISRTEIEDEVNVLNSGGGTDILHGLEMATNLIQGRRHGKERMAAIMLMSDGDQVITNIPKISVPVYTFGIGKEYIPTALTGIAKASGGVFSPVGVDDLNSAFAQCLAGLLTVALEDLKLIVTRNEDNSTIKKVNEGDYEKDNDGPISQTISFGNLYDKEVRRILVELHLNDDTGSPIEILETYYTYKVGGKVLESSAEFVEINRVEKSVEPENEEVKNEKYRLDTTKLMQDAKDRADANDLTSAIKIIAQAENLILDMADNELKKNLQAELSAQKMLMKDTATYKTQGLAFALSSQISHGLQRFASRGNDDMNIRTYATPRMNEYRNQSKTYEKDTKIPPPTVEEDVKQEIVADPLAAIAGLINYYIKESIQHHKKANQFHRKAAQSNEMAIQSLNTVQELLEKRNI
ncbi:hypothetical protein ACHQM5_005816 [Ranunculus cassubicifolius]